MLTIKPVIKFVAVACILASFCAVAFETAEGGIFANIRARRNARAERTGYRSVVVSAVTAPVRAIRARRAAMAVAAVQSLQARGCPCPCDCPNCECEETNVQATYNSIEVDANGNYIKSICPSCPKDKGDVQSKPFLQGELAPQSSLESNAAAPQFVAVQSNGETPIDMAERLQLKISAKGEVSVIACNGELCNVYGNCELSRNPNDGSGKSFVLTSR